MKGFIVATPLKKQPDRVTIQRLRQAPIAVQALVRKRAKPLSKLTCNDWFEIACSAVAPGLVQRAMDPDRERSRQATIDDFLASTIGRPTTRRVGAPEKFLPEHKKAFVDFAEAHRVDPEKDTPRSDTEICRLLIAGKLIKRSAKQDRPPITTSRLEQEARKHARLLSRFRKELGVTAAR